MNIAKVAVIVISKNLQRVLLFIVLIFLLNFINLSMSFQRVGFQYCRNIRSSFTQSQNDFHRSSSLTFILRDYTSKKKTFASPRSLSPEKQSKLLEKEARRASQDPTVRRLAKAAATKNNLTLSEDGYAEWTVGGDSRVHHSTRATAPNHGNQTKNRLTKAKKTGPSKVKLISTQPDTSDAIPRNLLRGFLDINPHMCSGCGSSFQSKSDSEPGFLPKEIMKQHHIKALMMQERQDAIRILDLAGIELDSDLAESVLSSAGKSIEIIRGVRELGRLLTEKHKSKFGSQSPKLDVPTPEPSPESSATSATAASLQEMDVFEGNNSDDDEDFDETDRDGDSGEEDEVEVVDYDESVSPSERLDVPELKDLRKKEHVEGILPTVSMIREAMARSLLPRKYRSSKYDATGVYDTSSPEMLDKLVQQALSHVGKATESISSTDVPAEANATANGVAEAAPKADDGVLADFKKLAKDNSVCICQRCYQLQQYGKVKEDLLPGWSDSSALTPQRFENLLSVIKSKKAVVLCILDIFDLRGSLINNLKNIAGDNPIIFAVNKVDLLPKDASFTRVKSWIYSEIKRTFGFRSPKEAEELQFSRSNKRSVEGDILRLTDIHLMSCVDKHGIDGLMHSLKGLAATQGNSVYIMGSANVGKSSFVNLLLDNKYRVSTGKASSFAKDRSRRDGIPKATVSPIPGTTLDFLKIKMHNGLTFIDTPGLINSNQLTSRLNPEELKLVIPKRQLVAVTFRLEEGKCIMIGGLATIQLTEGRPFFFTVFASREIPVRVARIDRVADLINTHTGTLIFPPSTPERYQELLPMDEKVLQIQGDGWLKASTDIAIAGLGWVSITGVGDCKVKVTAPHNITVDVRPALLPFEASSTHAKFTGGKIEQHGTKGKRGFRR